MPVAHPDKFSILRASLFCLLLGVMSASLCQAEEPVDAEGKSQADTAKSQAIASKPAAPKKTEYEKLPLAQLVKHAKAGDLKAQFELGSRINYGRGIPKNTDEALRWLRLAAEKGQQDAQRLLAVKLYNGYDVPADYVEALKWTESLAEAGDVPAQLTLANMYASGEGTERNLVLAYEWYDIASASLGREGISEDAAMAAQTASEQRENIASILQPEQEAEAQRLASGWWLHKQGVSLTETKRAAVKRKTSPKGTSKPVKRAKSSAS